MELVQIPPDQEVLTKVWPVIGPLLERAIDHARGTATIEQTVQRIVTKDAQLWVVVDPEQNNRVMAAGVTSLQKYATGPLVCNIELFGGDNMKSWFDQKEKFEDWAKEEGCNEIRLYARKGWARHLKDYNLTHYLMVKDL